MRLGIVVLPTRVGFVERAPHLVEALWSLLGPDYTILDKIGEELDEVRAEIASAAPRDRLEDEVGDLLFAVTNLARRLELDPELALRNATAKFERRFHGIEARLAARGETVESQDLDELDRLWDEVKAAEGEQ